MDGRQAYRETLGTVAACGTDSILTSFGKGVRAGDRRHTLQNEVVTHPLHKCAAHLNFDAAPSTTARRAV